MEKYKYIFLISMMIVLNLVISYCLIEYKKQPNISSVNIKKLMNNFIESNISTNLSSHEVQLKSQNYLKKVDFAIQVYSKKNNSVLILSDIIVAGVRDVTADILELLDEKITGL